MSKLLKTREIEKNCHNQEETKKMWQLIVMQWPEWDLEIDKDIKYKVGKSE